MFLLLKAHYILKIGFFMSLITIIGIPNLVAQNNDTIRNSDSLFLNHTKFLKNKLKISSEKYKSNDTVFEVYENFKSNLKKSVGEKVKHELKNTRLKGELNAFQKYGILTEYLDTTTTDPLFVYGSRGDLQLNSFNVPVKIQYNIASYQNPIGVNNYFKISYDYEQLKNKKLEFPETDLEGKLKGQMDKNISVQNDLKSNISFSEILQEKLKTEIEQRATKLAEQELEKASCKDSTQTSEYCDSISKKYEENKQKIEELQAQLDTVNYYHDEAVSLYDDYQYANETLKEKGDFIKNNNGDLYKNKVSSAINSFMGKFSKFNVGLSNPSMTGLSQNSVPMKGLNFEIEKEKWFVSFAGGYLINNLFVSNDKIQNQLQNTQNLFNQFDFQEIRENPFILHTKGGIGKKTKSHAFIGLNYLSVKDKLTLVKTPIFNLELDLKYAPQKMKSLSIDLITGKTSKRDSMVQTFSSSLSSLFDKNTETSFSLLKVNYKFEKLKTEVVCSFRNISSLTDTKVFGVLQPDNRRYEFKSKHKISKKTNLVLNVRYDRNNLDNRLDSTLNLTLMGGQISTTVLKKINLTSSYNLIKQQTYYMLDDNRKDLNSNFMFNNTASYQYSIKKTQHLISVNYNEFKFSFDGSLKYFKNSSIQQVSNFKKSRNTISLSYFIEEQLSDIKTKQVALILNDEFSFRIKKLILICGVKFSNSTLYQNDFGGKLDLKYPVFKSMTFNLLAEKLVFGDYYNYYNPQLFERFPYLITTKLTYTLK